MKPLTRGAPGTRPAAGARRVLFLGPSLSVGGEERVVFDLVTHLDRTRFAPTIVCCYELGAIGEQLKGLGLPVYHNLFRSRADPRGVRRLVQICRRERFDLLHVNEQPLAMLWGRIVGGLTGIRASVMAIHATDARGRRRRYWLSRLLPFDAIVALSQGHKRALREVEGFPGERVHVIHNGIDPTPYLHGKGAAPRPAGVPDGVPLVGIVAMLRPEKAHDVFLAAAAEVSRRSPAHFLVVGDGPERVRLEQLAHDLGLAQRVHFLGRREDVPQIMATLDVVVLSSATEAAPIVILEAMASAKPVACMKVGLIEEIVVDRETGLLVEPGQPALLARAILDLLDHPETAMRMGEKARERALQLFTLQRMVERTEDLFERLLAPEARP